MPLTLPLMAFSVLCSKTVCAICWLQWLWMWANGLSCMFGFPLGPTGIVKFHLQKEIAKPALFLLSNINLECVKLLHIVYKLSSRKHPAYMEMTVIERE